MGMTATEFWDDDPLLIVAFREAQKLKNEDDNFKAWLLGAYIHDAVSVVIGNAFRKANAAPYSYIKEPIKLYEEPVSEEERKENMRQEVVDYFNALQASFKAREKANG